MRYSVVKPGITKLILYVVGKHDTLKLVGIVDVKKSRNLNINIKSKEKDIYIHVPYKTTLMFYKEFNKIDNLSNIMHLIDIDVEYNLKMFYIIAERILDEKETIARKISHVVSIP